MSLDGRLRRLEIPTREQYDRAFRRASLRIVQVLGASLTDEELDLVRGGSEEADAVTLHRYRASLPEKQSKAEGAALLSGAYREAGDRGADVWYEDEGSDSALTEVAGLLEGRGEDASALRYFTE